MSSTTITHSSLAAYANYLQMEERSVGTVDNYLRSLRTFVKWLGGAQVDKAVVGQWKEHLLDLGYAPVTINAMLAAVHSYLHFRGWDQFRVHYLRVQRRLFRDDERALSRDEYMRLLRTAYSSGQRQLGLIIETLGATGIRVSELSAITVEVVKNGHADIRLKGKIRTILIPHKLSRKLQAYARAKKITSGAIFITTGGKSISRFKIWAAMKQLAKRSGVAPGKVFPHNLRHLFATEFYAHNHDIARLADLLGHSSIETTRLYLAVPGRKCLRQLESLRLIL